MPLQDCETCICIQLICAVHGYTLGKAVHKSSLVSHGRQSLQVQVASIRVLTRYGHLDMTGDTGGVQKRASNREALQLLPKGNPALPDPLPGCQTHDYLDEASTSACWDSRRGRILRDREQDAPATAASEA